MTEPVVALTTTAGESSQIEATGDSFVIREWSGSGPAELHAHHADDEAWHVLTGTLHFRFADGKVDAPAGATVFVPAGVAHTFVALTPETRYLIILTKRLLSLIESLHSDQSHDVKRDLYAAHASELLE
jgi:mannose-6-phosphate isomerase-like protein (cupin superfamily)